MIKKLNKYLIVLFFGLSLIACDSNSEKTQNTLEDRLVDNFSQSDQAVRDRVQVIIAASNNKNYKLAMNELGILADSRTHSGEQRQAINFLMTQLRFNLEDEDLLRKSGQAEN
mgnify:CR=1 FL=1